MNFDVRKLSNEALNEKLNTTVREERRLTIEVLHLLREVEKRELFARMGYSSLFVYCVNHLKYSESAAQRRIVAMRALQALPELEEKIETGKISLSVLALTETTLKQNAKKENRMIDPHERRETLKAVEGLSRRKAEMTLIEKFELVPPKVESLERPLNSGGVRIVLEFTEEEMRAIDELRRLSSRPQTAKEMVLSLLRAESAKRKRQIGEEPLLRKPKLSRSTQSLPNATSNETSSTASAGGGEKPSNIRKPIPTAAKREVWIRAKGQCEHPTPQGSRCLSRHTLEFDHIVARALGGTDESANLRLLCRAHHRLVTTEMFGVAKMREFRSTLQHSI